MTDSLPIHDWLKYLGEEYYKEYIPSGGAAIKFVIVDETLPIQEVRNSLFDLANQHGLAPIFLDSSMTKVHMIDKVFSACASQVPWDRLTDFVLKKLANDEGFYLTQIPQTGQSYIESIASENDLDMDMVRKRLVLRIQSDVFKDKAMVRDFRIAMTHLCQGRLSALPGNAEDSTLIQDWLTGRIERMGLLRPLSIFNKINRANARQHLESLFHWIRKAGILGTLVAIDLSNAVQPSANGEKYSRSSLLDLYEMLRQFIDGVSGLEATMIVAISGVQMLDPDGKQRGLMAYQALRNRVYDEVRDRSHPNPAGTLVRLFKGAS